MSDDRIERVERADEDADDVEAHRMDDAERMDDAARMDNAERMDDAERMDP